MSNEAAGITSETDMHSPPTPDQTDEGTPNTDTPERVGNALRVTFDPAQFDLLTERLKKSPRNIITIEDALRILQMIAILVAAVWTWNEYRQFKHESQKLQLERDRLDAVQRQLMIDLTSLDMRLKRTEVDATEQSAVGFDIETNVQQDRPGIQRPEIKIRVRNSSKLPINVQMVTIELYVGSLSAKPTRSHAVQLNQPTKPSGPISWLNVWKHTYLANDVLPEASLHGESLGPGHLLSRGSPAFGTIVAGDDSNFASHEYRIAATGDQWIGFVEDFTVKTQDKKTHTYSLYQWRSISEPGWQDRLGRPLNASRSDVDH